MKPVQQTLALLALATLGGCEGRTDENIQAAVENEAEDFGNDLQAAAEEAANGAVELANEAGEEAAEIRNEISADDAAGENQADNGQQP